MSGKADDVLPARFGALLLAAALLGQSLTYSSGAFSTNALLCVVVALSITIWLLARALTGEEPGRPPLDATWTLALVWIALFGVAFSAWNQKAILVGPYTGWDVGPVAHVGALILLLSYLPWLPRRLGGPRIRALGGLVRFGSFGLLVLLAGADAIRSLPRPDVDVWTVQTAGVTALLEGKNPYQVVRMVDTGPRPGAVDVPYVYAPGHLLVTIPFQLLAGDVRYAPLLATVIAGVAMRALARDEGLAPLARDAPALALWLSPKLYMILEIGWTDPLSLMWIALAVTAHVAGRRTLAAALFGAALASKQSMFWLAPLAGLLLRFTRRQWLWMLAVPAAVVLPFAAWDLPGLLHANFGFLTALPFRSDGLTLTSWAGSKLGFIWPPGVAFALAALVVGLAAWRLPRGTASFSLAAVVTYFVTFAFNKWAFANYYTFVVGLAALAAATLIAPPDRADH